MPSRSSLRRAIRCTCHQGRHLQSGGRRRNRTRAVHADWNVREMMTSDLVHRCRARVDGMPGRGQRHSATGLCVQFPELVHDDRTLLSEAVAEIAGQREGQERVDERGHTDAADGVGHGGWIGLLRQVQFAARPWGTRWWSGASCRETRPCKDPGGTAPGVVGTLGENVEDERHAAALLPVPESFSAAAREAISRCASLKVFRDV